MSKRVMTLDEFNRLSDRDKGYASYMLAMLPESQVPDEPLVGVDLVEWERGRSLAVQHVIDIES